MSCSGSEGNVQAHSLLEPKKKTFIILDPWEGATWPLRCLEVPSFAATALLLPVLSTIPQG